MQSRPSRSHESFVAFHVRTRRIHPHSKCIRPAASAPPAQVSQHEQHDDRARSTHHAREPARQRSRLRSERRPSRERGRDSRHRSAKDSDGGWWAAELRSGVPQHGVVPQRDHLHRRRQGDSALSRLSDRAARRQGVVPRGGVAASPWRAAHARRVRLVGARHHVPHVRAREREDLPPGLPVRRAPNVDAVQCGRGALELLSERQEHLRSGGAQPRDHSPDREAADARRVLVPAHQGAAVRLSGQRSLLRRELSEHGGAHDRATVRGAARVHASDGDPVHPARGSRAELLHQCGARGGLVARRSVLRSSGRHRGALRPAARRGERGGAPDDPGDRPREERAGVHQRGEVRGRAAGSWASATACTRATIRARAS